MGLLFSFFFPLYDQIYLLPDETYFKFRGLTCLQEVTMLTAFMYKIQLQDPCKLEESQLSLFLVTGNCTTTTSRGLRKKSHATPAQDALFSLSFGAWPTRRHRWGCCRSQKAHVCPPRDPRFDVQGSQFPQGRSIAPSAQGDGAGFRSLSHGQK